jgi:hypothetical protein
MIIEITVSLSELQNILRRGITRVIIHWVVFLQLAVPIPSFTGGFLGVESTIAFTSAQVSFRGGPNFAFDNLEFEPTAAAVPEPSSLILLAAILLGCGWWWRRQPMQP